MVNRGCGSVCDELSVNRGSEYEMLVVIVTNLAGDILKKVEVLVVRS